MKTDINVIYKFFNSLELTLKSYKKLLNINLKKLNISFDQMQVLQQISIHNELNQVKIANNLGKDNASITRIIDILHKKGLLSRNKSNNNRKENIIVLTNEGNNIIDKSNIVECEINEAIFRNLKFKRINKFSKELKKINKFLNNQM